VGRRVQTRRGNAENRIVLRLTASYLAIFVVIIASLSVVAFLYVDRNARDVMEPLLATPEGAVTLARYERTAGGSILSIDLALAIVVGFASYALARAAVRPLALAREREERFAADAAHELRTPLSVIASVAQAASGGSTEEQRAAFASIARRAVEASELIGDMLTLARKGGADVLDAEPVDLGALTRSVARDFAHLRPGVTIETDVASTIIDGDERRLLQLTRNLLSNAVRHARSRVWVHVAAGDGWAVLRVRDDGPGIPDELRPRLFERFAKGEGSTGSGLGLAICRWVARAHGGDISLDGAAELAVRLPLGHYPDLETDKTAT
jgi:signal transduction histidine kinase